MSCRDDVGRRLAVATKLACQAGELLLEFQGSVVAIDHKGRTDLVTEADRESQLLITEGLAREFPDHVLVGEEDQHIPDEGTLQGRSRWYIDPLDGTTNYVHGRRHFAVSIGWYDSDDRAMVGVVNAPGYDELFTATAGGGATRNGNPIHVTDVAVLADALVGSGFPYDFRGRDNLAEWARIAPKVRSVRSCGAAALDLCEVAAGRLDGFWEQKLGRWDTAAGALIAAEAGARVTELDAQEMSGPHRDVLAANPALHEHLRLLLRP